ncbi:MAG: ankyrin repeat domain-containing protein, partial [Verrucomicrobiales bacterium]|nr:ankyrin repeat domain-containing protein [Verrucomicrobiales bacterium]
RWDLRGGRRVTGVPTSIGREDTMPPYFDEPDAIVTAAAEDCFYVMSKCVERGDNVNYQDAEGRTALHYAVENRRPDMVEYLLRNGADRDIEDLANKTPIDLAAGLDHDDIIDYF